MIDLRWKVWKRSKTSVMRGFVFVFKEHGDEVRLLTVIENRMKHEERDGERAQAVYGAMRAARNAARRKRSRM